MAGADMSDLEYLTLRFLYLDSVTKGIFHCIPLPGAMYVKCHSLDISSLRNWSNGLFWAQKVLLK